MFEQWRKHIATICAQVLSGSMSIEDFYRQWPEELHVSDLANHIYEDLEDGIQHFPSKIFSGIPDYKSWESSDTYRRIFIISELLKTSLSESEMMDIRRSLLTEGGLSITDIRSKVLFFEEKKRGV